MPLDYEALSALKIGDIVLAYHEGCIKCAKGKTGLCSARGDSLRCQSKGCNYLLYVGSLLDGHFSKISEKYLLSPSKPYSDFEEGTHAANDFVFLLGLKL